MSKQEEEIKTKKLPKNEDLPPIIDDDGINLMPVMTKTEVVAEKRKIKVNVGAVVSIVVFLFITIGVVAFSTISKVQLNKEKEALFALENEVKSESATILNNQELLKRVYLYRDISSSQFSARKIFDYFSSIASKQGDVVLKSFVFGSERQHAFEGSTDSLDTASKLWYLLKKDKKVEAIVVDDLSKTADRVNFSFKVTLVQDAFKEDERDSKPEEKEVVYKDEDGTSDNDSWESYDTSPEDNVSN